MDIADVVGDSARPESSELDAADADLAFGQQFVGPARLLRELQARLAEMDDVDADVDHVVEARRLQVAQRRFADDEGDALVAPQRLLAEAEAAQPLGARALEELEVVGVEDDAGGVGVFPIDTDRHAKRGGVARPHRSSSPAREAAGSGLAASCRPGPRPDGRPRTCRARSAVGLAGEPELGLAIARGGRLRSA